MKELYEIPFAALVLSGMMLCAIIGWGWMEGVRRFSQKEEMGKGWSQLERKVREVKAKKTETHKHFRPSSGASE